jgi:arylsulfatase A-like enzyme
LNLGGGPTTDVLAISLSGTDYVGHFFGPESKEQHDQIVRLDRILGAFFDTLYTIRDSAKILVAMTADHGTGLIPELHGRRRVNMAAAMEAAVAVVAAAGGDTSAVDFESGAFFVDPNKLGRNLTVDAVTAAFIAAAKRVPGVFRAERFAEFASKDTTKDYIARRWLHMFPDDLLPTAAVTLESGDIYNYPIVATHGSPHLYDSHVPLIFYGPPFKRGRYGPFVRTVDIAPTLARVLGLTPAERLDGRVLPQALR